MSVTQQLKTDFLSVVLKVSERCNLACPYCYFFFSGDDSYKLHPPFISEETLESVIAFTCNAKAESGARAVRIGFHGGEPLLLKKQRFRDMCVRFREALGDEATLTLVVQTNGVLIDPEWVDLFAECKVRIGVSMDGNEAMHDQTRITKKGKGTYAQTRRGWELLVKAAEEGRINFPGILCVVSPQHSGKEIFDHFVYELGARGINFLLPDFTHDATETTPELIDRCGDFMIDVTRAWSECKTPDISVRFIDEIVGPMINDELFAQAQRRHDPLGQVCISSNGEICPDDVMRSFAEHFSVTAQHVDRSSFADIAADPAWSELRRAQDHLPEPCQTCTWKNVCGGGLLQHRYSRENGFANPSIYCPSLKRLYSYVASRLVSSGFSIDEIERRIAG